MEIIKYIIRFTILIYLFTILNNDDNQFNALKYLWIMRASNHKPWVHGTLIIEDFHWQH